MHKDFHFGERVTADLGADFDNLFNHPLFSPDSDYGGGGGPFAFLGDFNIAVDPVTLKPVVNMVDDGSGTLVPDVTPNPDFGRLMQTFTKKVSTVAEPFDCGSGLRSRTIRLKPEIRRGVMQNRDSRRIWLL